jgi:NADH:ubiquinone oxidoreductase subunit 4 (subunit M)
MTVNATDIPLMDKLPALLLAAALLIVGIYPNILVQLLK